MKEQSAHKKKWKVKGKRLKIIEELEARDKFFKTSHTEVISNSNMINMKLYQQKIY